MPGRWMALTLWGFLAALVSAVAAGAFDAAAQTQATPARAAIVLDMTTGAVLMEKNADESLPPASMSKLMTLDLVFEALAAGHLALDDTFRVSARAAKMGGSKMFIREGELVSVQDLLRGVIVQSGNDAAVALAEAVAGTEEAFVAMMNRRAREIGLTNSHFANATGWPDPDHYMSVRDLATLAGRIITTFPDYYPLFAETEFTWDGITQKNRNPLLDAGLGVDGLKTGHTQEAGYGLVASAKRGDRRIIMVVAGLESEAERRRESERLISWAFRAFETVKLFEAGERVVEARVWIGAAERVPLAAERDVVVTVPRGQRDAITLTAHFVEPVSAPIAQGQPLGRLVIQAGELAPVEAPLVAATAVPEGGIGARLEAAARLLGARLVALVRG